MAGLTQFITFSVCVSRPQDTANRFMLLPISVHLHHHESRNDKANRGRERKDGSWLDRRKVLKPSFLSLFGITAAKLFCAIFIRWSDPGLISDV